MFKQTLVLALAITFSFNVFADTNTDVPKDAPEVMAKQAKASQVKTWKAMGKRWAAGLDSEGRVMALYDLSYPHMNRKISLGRVGNSPNKKDVQDFLAASALEGSDKEQKMLEKAMKVLSKDDKPNTSPTWWKEIAWNNASFSNSNSAPKSFRASDLNMLSMSEDAKKVNSEEAKISKNVELITNGKFTFKKFLSQFVFEKQSDGTYEVTFEPLATTMAEALSMSEPKKIADLVSPKAPLYSVIAYNAYKKGVNTVVGMVQIPVANAILSTAVDMYFSSQDRLMESHQEMAVEMLQSAREKDASAFSSLSEQEIQKATDSIVMAQSGYFGLVKWFFQDPSKNFDKMMDEETMISLASRNWLANNGLSIFDLNSRFTQGTQTGTDALYLASRACKFKVINNLSRSSDKDVIQKAKKTYECGKNGPIAAVDYKNPGAIAKHRAFTQKLSAGLHFSTNMVPAFGGIVWSAYNYLVVKPMEVSEVWESRLLAHLEERELAKGENRTMEIDTLYDQRMNPVELNKSDTDALIAKRKLELGVIN